MMLQVSRLLFFRPAEPDFHHSFVRSLQRDRALVVSPVQVDIRPFVVDEEMERAVFQYPRPGGEGSLRLNPKSAPFLLIPQPVLNDVLL